MKLVASDFISKVFFGGSNHCALWCNMQSVCWVVEGVFLMLIVICVLQIQYVLQVLIVVYAGYVVD